MSAKPPQDSPSPDSSGPGASAVVSALTVDCADPAKVAEFWRVMLGGEVVPFPGYDVVSLRATGITLDFVKVDEAKANNVKASKNRWHLDLASTDHAKTVDQAIAAGASLSEDICVAERFTVMRDVEGNEFCILRHAPPSPWAPST